MLFPIVVPLYSLVWYNKVVHSALINIIVVPLYSLVWYNKRVVMNDAVIIVVPLYSLVWYNKGLTALMSIFIVVPLYSLVWYNIRAKKGAAKRNFKGMANKKQGLSAKRKPLLFIFCGFKAELSARRKPPRPPAEACPKGSALIHTAFP